MARAGYASPKKGQIFRIGGKLFQPFQDRLFLAGEHTQMDFFGYMEGALRSGARAAEAVMGQACGLPSRPKVRTASAAPTRGATASEHESPIRVQEHSATGDPGEAESPFLHHELFLTTPDEAWEPRAAALVAESPFADALPEGRGWSAEDQVEELAEEEGSADDGWKPSEPEGEFPSQGETFELDSQEEAVAPTGEDESERQDPWEELEETDHLHEEEEEPTDSSTTGEALDEPQAAPLEEQEWDSPPPEDGEESLADEDHWLGPDEQQQLPQSRPRPLSLMFRSTALPVYNDQYGKSQSTDCSVYVPSRLRNAKAINLLVFFHGDDSCLPPHSFNPYKVIKTFRLDAQVDNGQREVVLAVPVVYWKAGTSANVTGKWSAARLNAFVEEVLDEIGSAGVRPSLNRLILAGHSHAYAILTPLAQEFVNDVADTTKGALARLGEVWALDSTYGLGHAQAFKKWADKLPTVQFAVVLSEVGFNPRTVNCKEFKRGDPPIKGWVCAIERPKVALPANLAANVKKASAGHCALPTTWIENLLFIAP